MLNDSRLPGIDQQTLLKRFLGLGVIFELLLNTPNVIQSHRQKYRDVWIKVV